MLELQMGLNRDIRRERMLNEMKRQIGAGCQRIYMLVPEQSSFSMRREVCRVLGNDVSNQYVRVLGLDSMNKLVHEECGQNKEILDEGGRLLAMAQAVAAEKANLSAFKESATKPEFLNALLKMYGTFRLHGILVTNLEKASNTVKETSLKKKLHDMSVIFTRYEEICEKSSIDPADYFESMAQLLLSENWLEGTSWFIEGFADFPKQQMEVISAIIQKAAYVMVSLAAAGLDDEQPGHSIAAKTGQKLAKLADECEVVHTNNESSEHPALALIQAQLCDSAPVKDSGLENAGKVVKLFCDTTPYQECQHVISTIMRAVRNGYRYRDISIVLCDYDRYAPILETVCRRYDIPMYFSSQRDEIGKSPVLLSVFSALNCATRGMQKEDVLQYLKSGISSLTVEEVDVIENYIRAWNIHGHGFEPDETGWIMHPDGYGMSFKGGDDERLKEINTLREKGVGPLLSLKEKMKEAKTVSEYVLATYDFLESISFTEKLQAIVDTLAEEGNDQIAAEYAQVSSVLNGAMEQMYGVIGQMEKAPADFVKLFRLLCSAYKIATIPVSIDQVEVSNISDARYFCSKLRYIMGAEEGVFPAYVGNESLLTTDDIDALNKDAGIELPGSVTDVTQRGLNDIDTVVSGAKRMLVLSYASDPMAPSTPSHLYQRVQQMFPTIPVENGVGEDGISPADLMNPKMAGRLMGRIYNRPRYEDILCSLGAVSIPVLQDVSVEMSEKANWALGDLSDKSIVGLYGERISLSATRMDTYSACRYHYFLKYGLALKEPQRSKFDSPIFGRFAHYILETTAREVETTYGGFQNVSREVLESITKKHIEEYTTKNLKGLDKQPERYIYLYKRNCREVVSILRNLQDEFSASDFHCSAFELKVGGETPDVPAIRIKGAKMNGVFTGIADRVDVCDVAGTPYYRVVDYKTGKSKTFDMTDILCGMSMQLLMYQAALHRDGYGMDGTPAERAGMLYMPAKDVVVATSARVSDEKVEAERQKMQVRRGILLNDRDVLQSMEHVPEGNATYLPIRYMSDGSITGDICSAEQLAMLDTYADITMREAVDGISNGNVAANPISRGPERTACTYCPMKSACHKDSCGVRFRYRSQVKPEEFWAAIEKKVGEATSS